MRIFLAVEIPDYIKDNIYDYFERQGFFTLKGLSFVSRENLHLTIKFLGEQDDTIADELNFISDLRQKLLPTKINFSVFDYCMFSNHKAPRVLWVNVSDNKKILVNFARKLESELFNRKIIKESTDNFRPHITIARNKTGRKFNFDKTKNLRFGKFNINKILLFKSTLTKTGPIYEKIKSY